VQESIVFLVFAGLGGLLFHYAISQHRKSKDHREELAPIVARYGLTIESVRTPKVFDVGPFPIVEFEIGRPQTHIGGVRGEYNQYRVVTCHDSQNNVYELWAKLEFERFRLRRIRWRAEPDQDLPPQVRELLEN
jgi:hypothetical protein